MLRTTEAAAFFTSKYVLSSYSECFLLKFQSNFMLKYLLIFGHSDVVMYAKILQFNLHRQDRLWYRSI